MSKLVTHFLLNGVNGDLKENDKGKNMKKVF
jgi:hypothetical protein